MPTITRICIGCNKPILITSASPGPYAGQAIANARILCTDCVERVQPPRHPDDPEMVIYDDEELAPLVGVYCGKPWGNPESPLYLPNEPRVRSYRRLGVSLQGIATPRAAPPLP